MTSPLPSDIKPSATYARIINERDESISSFLQACESNDAMLVLQLVPGRDGGLLTLGLNRALRGGHPDLGRQLLALGVKWDGETVKIASESLEAMEMIVSFGFHVNDPLPYGGILLPKVIRRNDESLVRYLLSQGANPNLSHPLVGRLSDCSQSPRIQSSRAVLNAAAACSTPRMFALLLSYGASLSDAAPLHCAAGTGRKTPHSSRIPMMEYLVGLGLDVNAIDDAMKRGAMGKGQYGTPLHYAVSRTRVAEAEWLLAHGADPDKEFFGYSPRNMVNDHHAGSELATIFEQYKGSHQRC